MELQRPTARSVPTGDRPCGVCGSEEQHDRRSCGARQHFAGREDTQQISADKPSDHGAAPVERHVLARLLGLKRENIGLHQVVDHHRPDRHLGADIQEYAQRSESETPLPQEANGWPMIEWSSSRTSCNRLRRTTPRRHQHQHRGETQVGAHDDVVSCARKAAAPPERVSRSRPWRSNSI